MYTTLAIAAPSLAFELPIAICVALSWLFAGLCWLGLQGMTAVQKWLLAVTVGLVVSGVSVTVIVLLGLSQYENLLLFLAAVSLIVGVVHLTVQRGTVKQRTSGSSVSAPDRSNAATASTGVRPVSRSANPANDDRSVGVGIAVASLAVVLLAAVALGIHEAASRFEAISKESRDLRAVVAETTQDVTNLKGQVSTLDGKLKNAHLVITRVTRERNHLQTELGHAERDHETLERDLASWRTKAGHSETDLAQSKQEKLRLVATVLHEKQQRKAAEATAVRHAAQVARLSRQIAGMRQNVVTRAYRGTPAKIERSSADGLDYDGWRSSNTERHISSQTVPVSGDVVYIP